MVVEDNEVVRALLLEILSRRGCQVLVTSEVPEALHLARTVSLDAVITDYNLAGSSGLALVEQLRGVAYAGAIWIMSGSENRDLTQEAAPWGIAGFIRKPFTPAQLWQRLEPSLTAARPAEVPATDRSGLRAPTAT